MTTGIASIVFVLLLAVSMAHFMWAIGRKWPVKDEKRLAQTVVGFKGVERMPPKLMSFAVSVMALAAGIIGLSLADKLSGGWWLDALGILFGLVFLARGVLGYTAYWAALTPEEPFRTLDRKNYSPLCLVLGLGFLTLVILRLL